MAKVKKTISIRPLIWEMISKEAKARGVSITRCIEDKFEFEGMESMIPYSLEDDAMESDEGKVASF